jgi:hypothetical protein
MSLEDLMRFDDYDVFWRSDDSAYGYTEKVTGGPTFSLEPGLYRSRHAMQGAK